MRAVGGKGRLDGWRDAEGRWRKSDVVPTCMTSRDTGARV